ncbi:hypothetical protein Daesc_003318 [Daldinia eschscholtzii]|uniref:Uncharacterized protein n=1 Tax=Daldinia eschscholtzii TaxID=292717 RepID=A0AAX6MSS6_9PEZI
MLCHVFHRDSFELHRERGARRAREREIGTWAFDDEFEESAISSLLSRIFARLRQAWSALPCSAASRSRQKTREGKSMFGKDKHARFADENSSPASQHHTDGVQCENTNIVATEEQKDTEAARHSLNSRK